MDQNLEGTGNVNPDDDRTTNDHHARVIEEGTPGYSESRRVPNHWDNWTEEGSPFPAG